MCEETGGYLMTWDGRAVVPQQMQLKDHVGELMHRLQKQVKEMRSEPEGEVLAMMACALYCMT